MKRIFRKMNWKGLLSAIVAIGVLLGVVAGVTAIVTNDTKTISSTAFSVGGLDANGKYTNDNQSIVTKDAFECIGLCIEQDFDSNSTYDVYYYDYQGHFIESKKGLSGLYDEDNPNALMARIVIHPEIGSDVDPDDFKVRFWEVTEYANDLKITVDKNQEYKYESEIPAGNMDISINTMYDFDSRFTEEMAYTGLAFEAAFKNYTVFIKVPAGNRLPVGIGAVSDSNEALYKNVISTNDVDDNCWVKLDLNIKNLDLVDQIVVNIPLNAEFRVYGYN